MVSSSHMLEEFLELISTSNQLKKQPQGCILIRDALLDKWGVRTYTTIPSRSHKGGIRKTLLCSNLLMAGWEGRWRVSNYLALFLTRNKGVKFSEAYCVWFAFCRECGSHTLDIGSHLQVSRCCLHHNLFTRTRIQKIRSVYTEQTTLALNNICQPNWPLSEVWSSKRYRQ